MDENNLALIKKLREKIKELEEQLIGVTEFYYEEGFDVGFTLGRDEGFVLGRNQGYDDYVHEAVLEIFEPKGDSH